jgi:hypothetical protein
MNRSPGRSCAPLWLTAFALLVGILLPSTGHAGPILGQIDTFQDGTTQGWGIGVRGGSGGPVNVATGGPDGAGDRFLQATSTGGPRADGRLTVFNTSQWAGDYLTAGVNAIEMDLKNFGTSDLFIRVAQKSGTLMNSPGFVTTDAFDLPADGQWHHVLFLLGADSLTEVGSSTLTLAALLSNVAELRIIESAKPALNGDVIAARIGIDNIRATVIPEPSTMVLLLTGCGFFGAARLLRRRR